MTRLEKLLLPVGMLSAAVVIGDWVRYVLDLLWWIRVSSRVWW